MEKKKETQIDMLHGPLLSGIFLFAMPLALSSILQQLFNSADTAIVGRFAGADALAAVGTNGELIGFFIEIFIGLSIGANVLIARYIGREETDKIQPAVHTVIAMALICGTALAIAGQFLAEPLLRLMQAPEEIMDPAVTYLRLYFIGCPFIALYNFGSAILQAKGDSRRPLLALSISGVVNVLLNLLFVVSLKMSVAGVALATVLSNLVSAALVIRMLQKEAEPYRFRWKYITLHAGYAGKIIAIGLPAGIQGAVFCLSNIFIQSRINILGPAAIAGNAAALNLELFSYYVVTAFGHASTTFVSQNYAAGNYDRCRRIFRVSLLLALVMSAVVSIPLTLWRRQVILLYTIDEAVISIAMIRIMNVLILEPFCSFFEVPAGVLRGMGHSVVPAVETILGTVVFRLLWIAVIVRRENTFVNIARVYRYSWLLTAGMLLVTYWLLVIRKKDTIIAATR